MSRVTALLTDAPGSDMIQSAKVTISTVYLVGGDGTARDTLATNAGVFDLLDLQNGVTTFLGTATVVAGDYEQLRLVVTDATITLKTGFTFSDGTDTRDLKVPSGPQSGIKVEFGGSVHITPPTTSLTVDFPIDQNFVFTGGSSSPDGVLFTPTLHGNVTQ
jgi:uncharacterized protein DUF4382